MDTTHASKIEGGFSWSIASHTSRAMAEAERRYGARVPDWFYAGYEFAATGPQTWYPGSGETPPRKHVVVQLSPNSQLNFHCAIFELAHEVIHLLSPAWPKSATNLEEGLAAHFADEYCIIAQVNWRTQHLDYIQQRDLVVRLLLDDPTCIARIRAVEPLLSSVSSSLLRQQIPGLSQEDADYLATTWTRATPR